MFEFHRLKTVQSLNKAGNIFHGARTVERDHGDDVLKSRRLHLDQRAPHAGAFHLKDAADFAAGEEGKGVFGGFALIGDVVEAVFDAVALLDEAGGLAHHREGAEAEEVNLEEADGFEDGEFVLGDGAGDAGFGAAHERGVMLQLAVGDDDGGGMDAGVAGDAFELHGRFEQFLDPLFLAVEFEQLLAVEFVALGEAVLDGDGFAGDAGDELGDAVDQGEIDALGAADIAHGGLGFHAVEGGDLGDLAFAELFNGVADHLFALVVGVIEVKVRHGDAAGVEEALEDEVIFEGVDAGDADAVGDERAGARTAHIPPDVAAAGKVAEVGDDQVVDVEAHLVDGFQLALFAFLDIGVAGALGIEALDAQLGQVAEVGFIGKPLWDGQVGQVIGGVFEVHFAHFGDAQSVVEGAGRQVDEGAEGVFHLGAALEEVGAVAHAHAVLLADLDAGLDAEEDVMRAAVLLAHIVHVVGGDQLQAELLGPGDQGLVDGDQVGDRVFLQLDKEIVAAEDIDIPAEALIGFFFSALVEQLRDLGAEAAGGADNPFGVRGQKFVVHARAIIVAAKLGVGCDLEHVAIAHHVFGEQEQVVVFLIQLGVAAAHGATVDGLIGFDADEGADALFFAGAVEFNGAMHDAMIGQSQGGLAEAFCFFDEVFDASKTIEEGVLGMDVEVDKVVGHGGKSAPRRCAQLCIM